MRGYNSGEYDHLFHDLDCTPKPLTDSVVEGIRHGHKNVTRYRVKTIKCGDVIEIEVYPLHKSYDDIRTAKSKQTRETQRKVNLRNARKEFSRKITTNFTKNDLHVTLTYEDSFLPTKADSLPDEKRALRDIQNFMRRANNYHKKHGLGKLKYAYVIEYATADNKKTRVHHHVVMSGHMSRETIKSLWTKGHVRVEELTPTNGSLEGLALYLTKQGTKKHSKRWGCSRGLKKPIVTVSDHKLSKRKVERLARDIDTHGSQILTRAYQGYALDKIDIRTSEWTTGAYIYATMYKTQEGKRYG